jgi:hypothetical protein
VKPAVAAKFAVAPLKTFASSEVQELSVSVMETTVPDTTSTIFEAVAVQPSAFVMVTK